MSRLLLVSNRLPLTAERRRGKLTLKPSAGGLATGLHSVHDPGKGLWFGWSGLYDKLAELTPATDEWKRRGCVPVPLKRTEVRDYYEA